MVALMVRPMKRAFDMICASGAIALLAAPVAIIAIIVRLRLGSPVLFRQQRPGLDGKPFELVKFRTMTQDRGADGVLLPDAERLPPFGKFLRASSLDEIPELWNVVKGEMSLVGPRPLLMHYLPLYDKHQMRRHEVRPGITGLAQISGRNAMSWEDKFAADIWYVENRTFALDLRILWRTIMAVVRRDGISADGHATMAPFTGNKP